MGLAFLRARRIIDERDKQKIFAVVRDRLNIDAERSCSDPAVTNHDARLALVDLADRGAQLCAQCGCRHFKQIVRRIARGDLQVSVGRPERIQALAGPINQHGGWGMRLDHDPPGQIGNARCA